jgi:predicted ATP-dependent serine protease
MQTTSYTIQKFEDHYNLIAIDGGESVTIQTSHPKYNYVQAQYPEKRIIKWNGTKMTSTKDYHNEYGKGSQETIKPKAPIKVSFTKLDDLDIDESLNIPMVTGTIADQFISNDGGFLPGTNVMAAGAPGVGKTTVLLELLSKLHNEGKRALFISAEMSQIDMARYLKRFPNWGQLPILFLSDYVDECPKTVVESALNEGWDIVLTDSYTEVNDTIKETCNLTRSKTEKWFLDLMINHNKALNKTKTYTCFVTILQLSKGGSYVGSSKLKHMTTSMMHLDWEGGENGRRYMEFSKNRCGSVAKKLYYTIGDEGLTFDGARYNRDLLSDAMVEEERKQLESEDTRFDQLFGFDTIEEDQIVEELMGVVAD